VNWELRLLYNINRLTIMMVELRTLQIKVMLAEMQNRNST